MGGDRHRRRGRIGGQTDDKIVVVPLGRIREEGENLSVPYSIAHVEDGPEVEAGDEISEEDDEKLRLYYAIGLADEEFRTESNSYAWQVPEGEAPAQKITDDLDGKETPGGESKDRSVEERHEEYSPWRTTTTPRTPRTTETPDAAGRYRPPGDQRGWPLLGPVRPRRGGQRGERSGILQAMLDFEVALMNALARAGLAPAGAAEELRGIADAADSISPRSAGPRRRALRSRRCFRRCATG